jgi:hypothetical protein
MKFSLRTLIVVMMLGGSAGAWGWKAWRRVYELGPARRCGVGADIKLEAHSMEDFPEPDWYRKPKD